MAIQSIVTNHAQIANSATSVANGLVKPRAAASTSSTSGTGSASNSNSAAASSASTITANDFLTLLVTEMKNQDPTQPTDPTAYITQMTQVNSLQQLIGINQGISTLDEATGATSATGS